MAEPRPAINIVCLASLGALKVSAPPAVKLTVRTRRPAPALESLLGGALAKKLGDIEVHEIGVMENDRLDRALHLVALVAVRGDDVQDFAGNAVLVGQRDTAERMPHLLTEFALDRFP